jgi:DNA-binding MarR family transcriptional regulator
MIDTRSATIDEIIQAQRDLTRAMSDSFGQIWMELDFSMPQLKTLITLHRDGAQPIGQIAETLGVGQPTASHLVDRLVQSDLVVRTEDPQDRRRTLAELSPRGVELIERLRQSRFDQLTRWLAQLDDAALAALRQGLRALAEAAAADVASARPPS